MFRALNIFPPGAPARATLEAPLSVTLLEPQVGNTPAPPVELAIAADAIFTTAVGHSSKRTLASWHVTTPQEIIDHMLEMVANYDSLKSNL
jgi:trehalose 6-phosphate synthase/phosphatase